MKEASSNELVVLALATLLVFGAITVAPSHGLLFDSETTGPNGMEADDRPGASVANGTTDDATEPTTTTPATETATASTETTTTATETTVETSTAGTTTAGPDSAAG